jgi:phosphomevalonate kinase
MSSPSAAASAPGKVFFAGGYLVLDRAHTALVFALNARIHVHVSGWTTTPINRPVILAQSPQFRDAKWLFEINASASAHAVTVTQNREDDAYTRSPNKFVETTLLYVLTYLSHISKDVNKSVKVTILADDDYYSQSNSSLIAQDSGSKPRFTDFGVKLSEAHKTGLGSSAALTTALTASILAFYTGLTPGDQPPLKTIHNLAQAAHCAAQGKVGSGFDVATAVYGSCLYRRFTPTILEKVGEPTSDGFGERLHRCVEDLDLEQKWDVEIASHAVQVPNSLLLVMCDVDCGSETPGMVRNVLKWRKENPDEAGLLWTALQQGTEDLCQELMRLTKIEGLSDTEYQKLGDIIQTIRSLVREMSQKSKVPIEPPVITELLDYCTSLPGVVGGICPGAGGYDAVAFLVKNDTEVVRALQSKLEGWKSKDAQGAVIGKVRLLGVKQEKHGVKTEAANLYEHWI